MHSLNVDRLILIDQISNKIYELWINFQALPSNRHSFAFFNLLTWIRPCKPLSTCYHLRENTGSCQQLTPFRASSYFPVCNWFYLPHFWVVQLIQFSAVINTRTEITLIPCTPVISCPWLESILSISVRVFCNVELVYPCIWTIACLQVSSSWAIW